MALVRDEAQPRSGRRFVNPTIVFLLGLISVASLTSQALAWEQVAYQQAETSEDDDTIRTEATHINLKENQKQIRICVEGRALRVRHVEIVFADKSRKGFENPRLIPAGSCTQSVELEGSIDKIILVYDRGPGIAPVVKIYAR
jgi:hypothetical protein